MDAQTRREQRPSGCMAVIASNRSIAKELFHKIEAGELPCLYASADEAEQALDSYPAGHRFHYRVFEQRGNS